MVMEQDPKKRIHNFNEVVLGYNEIEAINEATRCLQCSNPKCMEACPVNINIPKFISYIKKKEFDQALRVIKEANPFPAVCGRVCPQELLCENACVFKQKGKPIRIGLLERFVADHGHIKVNNKIISKKRIAIVGSGPAGLTCAAELALLGYKVVIFEALHEPGGVLRYGIPEFRLPKSIIEKEINYVKGLGVKIIPNVVIGRLYSLDDLLKKFDAVFIAGGAGLPYLMQIPGEELIGVYSANEFLTRINLMKAYLFPKYATPVKVGKTTVVIGGGNVAIDVARTALRLHSKVTVIYRRSFEEMPARREEVRHAMEEGVRFLLLTTITKIVGQTHVEGVECIQMRLGVEDETGRKAPIPIEGTEFEMKCDTVIIAIGEGVNPLLIRSLKLDKNINGTIIVDKNFMTSKEGVFAGGDIVSGRATVIEAISDGKKAAHNIHLYLTGKLQDG